MSDLVCVKKLAVLFSFYLTLLFLSDYLSFSCIQYISALFLFGNIMTSVIIYPPIG